VPTHVLLGRAAEIPDRKLAHLADDPLPEGVYDAPEAAIVRYAQAATRMHPIRDELYDALARHFSQQQIVELCFVVGLSNLVNRFHATFLTPVDEATHARLGAACPLPLPREPSGRE
jgi:alkylhydroperoxidase family enzyme